MKRTPSRTRRASRRHRRQDDVIGVDLGSTAVRITAISGLTTKRERTATRGGDPSGETPPMSARILGSAPLPAGAIVRGMIQQPQVVTEALRHLVAEHRLRGRRVVLGVCNPYVVVRALTLPNLPAEKLRQVLPFQARDILPFPVDDAVLDFSPIPTAAGVSDGAAVGAPVPGLLTAAPREAVMSMATVVQEAGMVVARVDLAPFGLLRSIGSAGPATEALVDIGAELTTIVVHRNGVPQVVRVMAFGGRQITDRVADALGVALDQAERLKCGGGVGGRDDLGGGGVDDDADARAGREIRSELRALVSEIRASINYYTGNSGNKVDRLLLTGGTARLPGLDGLLEGELGLGVSVTAPLRHVAAVGGGLAGIGAVTTGGSGEPGSRLRRGAAGGDGTGVGTPEVAGASAVSVGLALGVAA